MNTFTLVLASATAATMAATTVTGACADYSAGGNGGSGPPDGGTEPPPASAPEIALVQVASGLERPLHLTAPAGDPRLFVVEQEGRIRIVQDGQVQEPPFLDIRNLVQSGGERGLLSLAFHPEYGSNGRFFVNFTDGEGDTRVVEFRVSADPDRADPASGKLVLRVEQPFANHNGGHIFFGPEGMLFIGMGDGGSGGDPMENAQNLGTLLGKMLRIDVGAGDPYAIPPDNPFVDTPGARGEIWAYGLRNPWRNDIDRDAGLFYIADVGQNQWEEVNVMPAGTGGLNYGWDIMEGRHCFESSACDMDGLVLPVVEYSHDDGCSITGGHVYRGSLLPALQGTYFYSDLCTRFLRSFRYENGEAVDRREWPVEIPGQVLSFGVDASRELYILVHNGRVLRLELAE